MSHVAALFFSFLQHFKLFHFELQESCILQMPGVTNETGYWRSVDSELEAVCQHADLELNDSKPRKFEEKLLRYRTCEVAGMK